MNCIDTKSINSYPALLDPCVTDQRSWNLKKTKTIIIVIINLYTHHGSLYSADFASVLRNRGHSENPSSRVLHLRTPGITSLSRSSTQAAARSFWRCCCCSPPLLQTSHARSSLHLDWNALRWTRPTPNDVPNNPKHTNGGFERSGASRR